MTVRDRSGKCQLIWDKIVPFPPHSTPTLCSMQPSPQPPITHLLILTQLATIDAAACIARLSVGARGNNLRLVIRNALPTAKRSFISGHSSGAFFVQAWTCRLGGQTRRTTLQYQGPVAACCNVEVCMWDIITLPPLSLFRSPFLASHLHSHNPICVYVVYLFGVSVAGTLAGTITSGSGGDDRPDPRFWRAVSGSN